MGKRRAGTPSKNRDGVGVDAVLVPRCVCAVARSCVLLTVAARAERLAVSPYWAYRK